MDELVLKRCSRCKQYKPLSEFDNFKHSKDGKQALCRECQRANSKNYGYNNKLLTYDPRLYMHYTIQSGKKIAHDFGVYYDLTKQDIMELFGKYNYRCAFCGTFPAEIGHLKPVEDAGNYSYKNILPVCNNCKVGRHHDTAYSWIKKLGYTRKDLISIYSGRNQFVRERNFRA